MRLIDRTSPERMHFLFHGRGPVEVKMVYHSISLHIPFRVRVLFPMSATQIKKNREDLKMPRGLELGGKKAYQVVRQFLTRRHLTHTGGCKAFYKPAEWQKKENCTLGVEGAVLVVVYDGGDLAKIFNLAYGNDELLIAAAEDLQKAGFWIEMITHWWALIYPNKKGDETCA